MKNLLILILLSAAMQVHANVYYVSAAGSDTNPGTFSLPFKTTAKINSMYLQPGDQVLFRRGDVFRGGLAPKGGGLTNNKIIIGAYGTGAAPVISGLAQITSWTYLGGNIWESASAATSLTTCELVAIDGRTAPRGRWPNGYATIDSHNGTTSITDAALTTNFSGGRAIIRINDWTLDSMTFSQSGTILTFINALPREPKDGKGYMITCHPATLDQYGEWYFNPATKKVRVYTGSTAAPTQTIEVPQVTDALNLASLNNYTLQDITIEGGNRNVVLMQSNSGITFSACTLRLAGQDGIGGYGSGSGSVTACKVQYCLIRDVSNFGIDFRNAGNGNIITQNTIEATGLFPQQGGTTPQCRSGVSFNSGQGQSITYNRFDSTGMAGPRLRASYSEVAYNYITHFSMTLMDIGGLYCAQQSSGTNTGTVFHHNLIDGAGSGNADGAGTFKKASGIYLDDGSNGIEVAYNTAWNCPKAGLFLHNAHDINVHDNTFYNNGQANVQIVKDNDKYAPTTGLKFRRNIIFGKTATQWLSWFYDKQARIGSFGAIDTNYYCRPLSVNGAFIQAANYIYTTSTQSHNYTLAQWHTAFPSYDGNTFLSPLPVNSVDSLRFEFNASASPITIPLPQQYMDAKSTVYGGSITLQPYTSAVLIANGNYTGGIGGGGDPGPVIPEPPADSTFQFPNNGPYWHWHRKPIKQ